MLIRKFERLISPEVKRRVVLEQRFGEMRGFVLRMKDCAKFELWCFD